MKICSRCINAALDSGGVYCKMFHEDIYNERVAEDCGAFELEQPVQLQLQPVDGPPIDWGKY